jgi:hypothetical protein
MGGRFFSYLWGLLIRGLLGTRGTTFRLPTELQDSLMDTKVWVAATISKETLLLAVGIAGMLSLSRKRKRIEKGTQQAKPADTSDF